MVSYDSIKIPWPGWHITGDLGEGGNGKVYKIERTQSGITEAAALKVISIPKSKTEYDAVRFTHDTDEEAEEYFTKKKESVLGEIKTMQDLKGCSNIVSIDDWKDLKKENSPGWDIYIRMEILTPFKVWFKTREATEDEVIKLGIDICNALVRCEKEDFIHRDIKPENILINKYGEYKLADFGIARELDHTTYVSRVGTPPYMSPEIYNGEEANRTVDLYSLGLVMYELLNDRRLPFVPKNYSMKNLQAAIQKRMDGEKVPAPVSGSPEIKRIVLKACAYDPKDRYRNAGGMKRALEKLQRKMEESVVEDTEPIAPTSTDNDGIRWDDLTQTQGVTASDTSDSINKTDSGDQVKSTDALSPEELERNVFAENQGDEAEPEETEKIDKFYTLYRKNEEFQRLLDKEYEKLKGETAPDPPSEKKNIKKNINKYRKPSGKTGRKNTALWETTALYWWLLCSLIVMTEAIIAVAGYQIIDPYYPFGGTGSLMLIVITLLTWLCIFFRDPTDKSRPVSDIQSLILISGGLIVGTVCLYDLLNIFAALNGVICAIFVRRLAKKQRKRRKRKADKRYIVCILIFVMLFLAVCCLIGVSSIHIQRRNRYLWKGYYSDLLKNAYNNKESLFKYPDNYEIRDYYLCDADNDGVPEMFLDYYDKDSDENNTRIFFISGECLKYITMDEVIKIDPDNRRMISTFSNDDGEQFYTSFTINRYSEYWKTQSRRYYKKRIVPGVIIIRRDKEGLNGDIDEKEFFKIEGYDVKNDLIHYSIDDLSGIENYNKPDNEDSEVSQEDEEITEVSSGIDFMSTYISGEQQALEYATETAKKNGKLKKDNCISEVYWINAGNPEYDVSYFEEKGGKKGDCFLTLAVFPDGSVYDPSEAEWIVNRVSEDTSGNTDYGESVSASSVLGKTNSGISYDPGNIKDNDKRTAWAEGADSYGTGEYLDMSFENSIPISGLRIYNGYQKSAETFAENGRIKTAMITFDDGTKIKANLLDVFGTELIVRFPSTMETKHLRFTVTDVYEGTKYEDTCISEIRPIVE